jgi:hypothetical protein
MYFVGLLNLVGGFLGIGLLGVIIRLFLKRRPGVTAALSFIIAIALSSLTKGFEGESFVVYAISSIAWGFIWRSIDARQAAKAE